MPQRRGTAILKTSYVLSLLIIGCFSIPILLATLLAASILLLWRARRTGTGSWEYRWFLAHVSVLITLTGMTIPRLLFGPLFHYFLQRESGCGYGYGECVSRALGYIWIVVFVASLAIIVVLLLVLKYLLCGFSEPIILV